MKQTHCNQTRTIQTRLTSWLILLLSPFSFSNCQSQENFQLESPDRTISLEVSLDQGINYSVTVQGKLVVAKSWISMTLEHEQLLGVDPKLVEITRSQVKEEIKPLIREKAAIIDDHYNEMIMKMEGDYTLVFRAYDNGVAYRFQTSIEQDITVVSEQANFNFTSRNQVFFPEEDSFFSHNERSYLHLSLDSLAAGRLASLPVLVSTPECKVLITESALEDYPGLWLESGGNGDLNGTFPHYALESKLREGSDRSVPVTRYADFLAKTTGTRSFPWRILAIARQDADLITNQLVYQLADEIRIKNPAWIKPGKVAWDWWNYNNLYNVDFRAGVNTETYKYYIDFASRYGIEYIILDEGWYRLGDLLDVVPEMDVEELFNYARSKNVGIILWVVWNTLDEQLESALDQFEKWGAAGIKVDFMQRDDQEIVNYYWKIAAEAAKRELLVDFHGAYKPAGLRRAYPNVLTREGVKGLEHNKWSADITPEHNLILPFIRMVAGPMDYTPGAMLNSQPDNFQEVFSRPMSMGTRAHQLAMYIIYESPLQMMADSPSNYLKESESTQYIAAIPTTWDQTRVLEARIGEYLIMARKNGNNWYLAAMTDETSREFKLDLSFLDANAYTAEIMADGINADRYASDYKRSTQTVRKNDSITIKLAPAGGWSAILKPN